jgi:uncharacterized damage-inducible protein DinB
MSEITRINNLLKKEFEGRPAWHGSSVLQLVEDLTAEQALKRSIPTAHNIWEIIIHLSIWEEETRKCLEGESFPQLSDHEDWPTISDTSELAWNKTVENFKKVHHNLLNTLLKFDSKKLNDRINIDTSYPEPWSLTDFYDLLHGTIHHAVYHTGQIAILKK